MKESLKAYQLQEVPVGAIIVDQNKNIIAKAHNLTFSKKNPLYHAELLVLNKLAKKKALPNNDNDFTLYTTLEPCFMCADAIIKCRIKRLVFGASDYEAGAFGSFFNILNLSKYKKIEVISSVMADECKEIIDSFFKKIREN